MYELTGRAAWFTFRMDQTGSLRQARHRMVGRSVHKVPDRIYVELGTEIGRSGRIIDTVLDMNRGRIYGRQCEVNRERIHVEAE